MTVSVTNLSNPKFGKVFSFNGFVQAILDEGFDYNTVWQILQFLQKHSHITIVANDGEIFEAVI